MALNLLYEGLCCVLPIRRLRRDWTYHAKCTRLYVFRWIKQRDWATVTLYYKVTKTALAGFASRFHIVSSLFSLRCVYIIHRLRWVSAFSFSCVVMSIFSSSSLCVLVDAESEYPTRPMLMLHWYIHNTHWTAPIKCFIRLRSYRNRYIQAHPLGWCIETATAICV